MMKYLKRLSFMNQIKKCFTVTVLRSKEDIKKAIDLLVKTKIYAGCELFFPYDVSFIVPSFGSIKSKYLFYCSSFG